MTVRSRPARGLLFSLIVACVFPCTGSAAPLTLAAAERLALERDAGGDSLAAEADALRERALAARRLPDPEARIGALNVPVDSFSLSREDMTMVEIGVMQRFPRARAAESRRYSALADVEDAKRGTRRREVLTGLRSAWYEAAAARRGAELVASQRKWLVRALAAATSGYAAGEGSQAELLAARLELAMLDERALELAQEQAERRAMLARWLGPDAEPAPALPAEPPALEPLAALAARLDAHPSHAEIGAAVSAAEAEVETAQARFRPEFALDVGYGVRSGREMAGSAARPDMLSTMLRFELPLYGRERQRRELAAARAGVRAASAMRDDHLRELQAELESAYASADRARATLALLDERVLPIARAAADAARSGYRAGPDGFDAVAKAAGAQLDAELRRVRAAADLAVAAARIDALVGDVP